jgi:hypothetical protein
MFGTQQVQETIWYEGHNIKDKPVVRLNAEMHLHLDSLIINTYLLVEVFLTQPKLSFN